MPLYPHIINVGLGGTLVQDLEPDMGERHRYEEGDEYHSSVIEQESWLNGLYGGGGSDVASARKQQPAALDYL